MIRNKRDAKKRLLGCYNNNIHNLYKDIKANKIEPVLFKLADENKDLQETDMYAWLSNFVLLDKVVKEFERDIKRNGI